MPVDYSKWDALELSDDSDIEVHPNVDKRSFIKAKQAQIHADRARRRNQIETLEYEDIVNRGLLIRINRLLTALKSHKTDNGGLDEIVLQSTFETLGSVKEDKPTAPPPGVHTNSEPITYSKMMGSLIDQVKAEVEKKKPENPLDAFIEGVNEHKNKVEELQEGLHKKLDELKKEERKHITSDDIHTGFDYSRVNRFPAEEEKPKTREVELLNPKVPDNSEPISSGTEADVEDGGAFDPENIQPSTWGRKFADIPFGDYDASLKFISQHPSILTERESDALLIMAFDRQMDGDDKMAKQCIHQALLIQYCRQLGKDGVGLFFKRVTTKDHQARKLFLDDVNGTFAKIKERVKKLEKERAEEGGVEQIQLHAVDPSTTINIRVPPPLPTDLSAESTEPPPTEDQILGRRIFESFPPGLQRALESGSLDEINKVLGKMSVDEAEDVVAKLSEGGILSVEEGIVDATTEEGKQLVEDIESGRLKASQEVTELSEDPPLD